MQIKQLTNCNVYVNGTAFAGAASSVTLPEVKPKGIEHKAGDSIGTARIPSALEAMTCTLKMNGMYEDFHALMANPNSIQTIMVRANQKVRSGLGDIADEPVVAQIKGWCSSSKPGELKSSEGANPEYIIEVYYYKLTVNNVDITEIDIPNAVYKVSGNDILTAYRSNLGL
jgi:P2 family phage contractile tail tube protein